jgi:hypothetical protein
VRRALVLLALTAALASVGGTGATAASCSYPGDDASKDAVAAWMGAGAWDAGIPAELPVMAALVDSGLRNLPQDDRTTAGYFQMRVDIWNKGDYAGFPDHPTLQLQWFIDQAIAVRQKHVAAGEVQYGEDPDQWGTWVADVQRPAEQYRYRYQLRLEDARALIGPGCATPESSPPPSDPPAADPGAPPPPDAQLIPDSVLPRLDVQARRYQDGGRSGALKLTAACANESCLARAAAAIAIPGGGIFRISVLPLQLARGQRQTFRLTISKRVRNLIAASLRKRACPLAAVRVVAANAGGYRNSASRTVRVAAGARSCSRRNVSRSSR